MIKDSERGEGADSMIVRRPDRPMEVLPGGIQTGGLSRFR